MVVARSRAVVRAIDRASDRRSSTVRSSRSLLARYRSMPRWRCRLVVPSRPASAPFTTFGLFNAGLNAGNSAADPMLAFRRILVASSFASISWPLVDAQAAAWLRAGKQIGCRGHYDFLTHELARALKAAFEKFHRLSEHESRAGCIGVGGGTPACRGCSSGLTPGCRCSSLRYASRRRSASMKPLSRRERPAGNPPTRTRFAAHFFGTREATCRRRPGGAGWRGTASSSAPVCGPTGKAFRLQVACSSFCLRTSCACSHGASRSRTWSPVTTCRDRARREALARRGARDAWTCISLR